MVGVGVGLVVALEVGSAVAPDTGVGGGAVLGVDCAAFATGLDGRWPAGDGLVPIQPPKRATVIAMAIAARPRRAGVLGEPSPRSVGASGRGASQL
jgi:hypothetical protein